MSFDIWLELFCVSLKNDTFIGNASENSQFGIKVFQFAIWISIWYPRYKHRRSIMQQKMRKKPHSTSSCHKH
jgi:hypothetical protein